MVETDEQKMEHEKYVTLDVSKIAPTVPYVMTMDGSKALIVKV